MIEKSRIGTLSDSSFFRIRYTNESQRKIELIQPIDFL